MVQVILGTWSLRASSVMNAIAGHLRKIFTLWSLEYIYWHKGTPDLLVTDLSLLFLSGFSIASQLLLVLRSLCVTWTISLFQQSRHLSEMFTDLPIKKYTFITVLASTDIPCHPFSKLGLNCFIFNKFIVKKPWTIHTSWGTGIHLLVPFRPAQAWFKCNASIVKLHCTMDCFYDYFSLLSNGFNNTKTIFVVPGCSMVRSSIITWAQQCSRSCLLKQRTILDCRG